MYALLPDYVRSTRSRTGTDCRDDSDQGEPKEFNAT
jgi:hypothetical protein